MIPDFSLPSNPSIKIEGMRTATVADMLDFCEIEERREEVLITKFLNRVQSVSDARTWTGEDRLFAIFWYFIHTEVNTTTTVYYDCDCGISHNELIDYKQLGLSFKQLEGGASASFDFEGETVTIRPLNGEHLERLEGFSFVINALGKETPEYRRKRAEIDLLRLIMISDFGKNEDQEAYSENRIKLMDKHQFVEFTELVGEALEKLQHGLDSEYRDGRIYFLSPALLCPEKEVRETRVLIPFRCTEFLPTL